MFTRDIHETVNFLSNECTGDELTWLMEVADEISQKLQSWDFIDALYRCARKNPKEAEEYHIIRHISYAEGQLNDKVYYQRYPKDENIKKKEIQ